MPVDDENPEKEVKITHRERMALAALVSEPEGLCLNFSGIARQSGLPRDRVRRTVRALARKGLAEYQSGLFNDDGEVAGAGYCATEKGRALATALQLKAIEKDQDR